MSTKKLDVAGDFRALKQVNGTYFGLETNYDLGQPGNVMFSSNNLDLDNATNISTATVTEGLSAISSKNANAIATVRSFSEATGSSVSMEALDVTGTIQSSIFGRNTAGDSKVSLLHAKTSAELSSIEIEKLKGVTFSFQNATGVPDGYTFPRNKGLANQVLTTNGLADAQLSWSDISTITPEPWNEQGGTTKATANGQDIYQNGKVGIGNFATASNPQKQLEVKGDFKAEVNDGCPDAIEGAGNFTTLSTSTMPGGNTGATSGTFNLPIVQNLGTAPVGNTPSTMGIPTVAGTGQGVGTSAIANPVLLAGTASADQTIVSGTAPAALTLTGSTGTIQWQVSTDNITFNNVASAGTTASYSPGTLTATRYYRALVTSAGGCTATSNVVKIAVCAAGSVAPVFNDYINGGVQIYSKINSAYSIQCAGGAQTANLIVLVASPAGPVGTSVTWHSATPATDANRINPVTAVTGATRKVYAAFWDSSNSCYSPTKEITIYGPICATDDNFTATPILYGVATTLPISITANDTYLGATIGAPNQNVSIAWEVGNSAVVVNANGTLTFNTTAPTLEPGTYTYLYKICDLDPDAVVDSNCAWAEVTFKIISCTNPPNTNPSTDFTKTGISDIAGFEGGAVGWPGNVPNGFIAIESRNKGFVITRVASTSVITNPVLGMLVYDMSNSPAPCVKLYSDLGWNCLAKDCLPVATKN